jgi:hypothetical protein
MRPRRKVMLGNAGQRNEVPPFRLRPVRKTQM